MFVNSATAYDTCQMFVNTVYII